MCSSADPNNCGKQRVLLRGLRDRQRTVKLMLDETIFTETPPLRAMYAPVGEQAEVSITGNREKRVVHGVINVGTGHTELLITRDWNQEIHQAFLRQIRQAWRGWHIVLFEDNSSPHTAGASQELAQELNIEIRWLPVATPELNAMEGLWRRVKDRTVANRTTRSIDESVDAACRYILDLRPRERLHQAGILSGNFWLVKKT